jgi:hypothetical protein
MIKSALAPATAAGLPATLADCVLAAPELDAFAFRVTAATLHAAARFDSFPFPIEQTECRRH